RCQEQERVGEDEALAQRAVATAAGATPARCWLEQAHTGILARTGSALNSAPSPDTGVPLERGSAMRMRGARRALSAIATARQRADRAAGDRAPARRPGWIGRGGVRVASRGSTFRDRGGLLGVDDRPGHALDALMGGVLVG